MKKTLLLFFSFLCLSSSVSAQYLADGYYRVINAGSSRYFYLKDNKGHAKLVGANVDYDLDAVLLRKGQENTISDPTTIIYVSRKSGYEYDLSAQGTSIQKMTGRYVTLSEDRKTKNRFRVGATESGVTKYLADHQQLEYEYGYIDLSTGVPYNQWDAAAIDATSDNYFGLVPSVKVNGTKYAPFYAGFGFKPASQGMTVYYVSAVNEQKGIVCMKEVKGSVPNSTPVFVACSSDEASGNRLSLENNSSSLDGNVLKGNFFNFSNQFLLDGRIPEAPAGKENLYRYSVLLHVNQTAYNPSTMRVLGEKDGKLAYVKDLDLDYLPANQSYLVVSENAPDCLFVVSESEYKVLGIESMETDDESYVIYNLLGKQVSSKSSLSAGIYIINGKKTVIR